MGMAPFRRRKAGFFFHWACDTASEQGITKLLLEPTLSHSCSLCPRLRATFSPAFNLFCVCE